MNLTAACAFGIEAIVKRELIKLGYDAKITQPGRISFPGDWDAVCRCNFWLRTADRVLIEVQKFDAPDFDALFDTVKEFDWSQFIPSDASFPVIGRSRLSQLTSVPAVQRSVKRAIVESLKRYHGVNELPETGSQYKVEIAILNDVATLTIDTTGPSLHKRGYRKLVAEAPLKETLAAALVDLSVWNPERPLIDPFCGSGTIPIEAALIGKNVAPGMYRSFASSDWETIPRQHWDRAFEEAKDVQKPDIKLHIIGTDRDKEVLSLARYHSNQAGVADQVHFQHKSFDELSSKRDYGCVITNPPYGERLEDQQRLIGLYESIPGVIQRLPTWSLFLITNMPKFEAMIQKTATRRRKLFNGRLECTYYQFLGPRPPRGGVANQVNVIDESEFDSDETDPIETVSAPTISNEIVSTPQTQVAIRTEPESDQASAPTPAKQIPFSVINQTEEGRGVDEEITPPVNVVAASAPTPQPSEPTAEPTSEPAAQLRPQRRESQAVFGGLQDKDREQAGIFRNRLVKLAKHLRRWPTKRGITCFRLYERDIPEIPLVVDRYENNLHITEYDRPHERDLARHTAWLELMRQTAAEALDVPIKQTHLKKRRKSQNSRQYEKIDSSGKQFSVQEGGLKFLVNLTDYVDTGLFLDHRVTRSMVRDEAKGKDFLNLFAYTGRLRFTRPPAELVQQQQSTFRRTTSIGPRTTSSTTT